MCINWNFRSEMKGFQNLPMVVRSEIGTSIDRVHLFIRGAIAGTRRVASAQHMHHYQASDELA